MDTAIRTNTNFVSRDQIWKILKSPSMTYIRVEWKYSFANEPVWLYSELDDLRWEVRKVEV